MIPHCHLPKAGPLLALAAGLTISAVQSADSMKVGFTSPPASARPWVYWFWMDGNISLAGITADLEAMQRAGIGGVILMEVDVGVPRGPVRFMTPPWRAAFRHAVTEAERLGLQLDVNAGPGWTGSGGPWVQPEQSMQHLVASAVEIAGPTNFQAILPQPKPRPPYFGDNLPPALKQAKDAFYREVAVLAFPTPAPEGRITDLDEKALFIRHPYSSRPNTKPYFVAPAHYPQLPAQAVIATNQVQDLTARLQPDGRLTWSVPAGYWTVLRFGRTSTGANTRPAPEPGLGLECDKFDRAALEAHFAAFVGALWREVGPRPTHRTAGWTSLHIDSWEMGAQNWTAQFRAEFQRRRAYDPLPFLPVTTGRVVGSLELSERFLWDLRQTAQELVLANHAQHLKTLGRRYGFTLSIEPYDMNPTADLSLGAVADVPMGEFWSQGYGFDTVYSCLEAVSVAHTLGRPVVAAEAFTAGAEEAWRLYPGALKDQADWALGLGLNRLVFHRYAHQPWLDRWPGMTMGPYGVHYERTQTWWDMVGPWHHYLSRCQFLLQQGQPVADILYLAPEGAPNVFRPPASALRGPSSMPDHKGYNFDGCSPETLLRLVSVKHGRLVLPGGASYGVLVLPQSETMTPKLLRKIQRLAEAGATVIGHPPQKSPSLTGYPAGDQEVQRLATQLWGVTNPPAEHQVGRGRLIQPPTLPQNDEKKTGLYCSYDFVSAILAQMGVPSDFDSPFRYAHRRTASADIYFVANPEANWTGAWCQFRVTGKTPELWDPATGMIRRQWIYEERAGGMSMPLWLEPHGSVFVIFRKASQPVPRLRAVLADGHMALPPAGTPTHGAPVFEILGAGARPTLLAWKEGPYEFLFDGGRKQQIQIPALPPPIEVTGPWEVRFPSRQGAPEKLLMDPLRDWSGDPDPAVKHFSGQAVYRRTFALNRQLVAPNRRLVLDLGRVEVMAQVRLNGRDLGVLWRPPFRVDITQAAQAGDNTLEITVANLWPNRLIGDQLLPPDQRVTRTTWNPYKKNSPLLPAGLLGPVQIQFATETPIGL